MCVRERVCVRERERVCVCVCEREKGGMGGSRRARESCTVGRHRPVLNLADGTRTKSTRPMVCIHI